LNRCRPNTYVLIVATGTSSNTVHCVVHAHGRRRRREVSNPCGQWLITVKRLDARYRRYAYVQHRRRVRVIHGGRRRHGGFDENARDTDNVVRTKTFLDEDSAGKVVPTRGGRGRLGPSSVRLYGNVSRDRFLCDASHAARSVFSSRAVVYVGFGNPRRVNAAAVTRSPDTRGKTTPFRNAYNNMMTSQRPRDPYLYVRTRRLLLE